MAPKKEKRKNESTTDCEQRWQTIEERQVRLIADVSDIKRAVHFLLEGFENHLEHHRKFAWALLITALSALSTLAVSIIVKVL